MERTEIEVLINQQPEDLQEIGNKIIAKKRISDEECLILFEKASLSYVGALANKLSGAESYQDKALQQRTFLNPQ